VRFDPPLEPAVLRARRLRFLADVEYADGTRETVLCANTGRMLGNCTPGARVWLSRSAVATRKYARTWELIEVDSPAGGTTLVGINTHAANRLVAEALARGGIPALAGYAVVTPEVRYGDENSRVDFLLSAPRRRPCYVEVKNVNASMRGRLGLFPDAVTARGVKHLRELVRMRDAGARAVVLYCVQRGDVDEVRPAREIDPAYADAIAWAADRGVEFIAHRCAVSSSGIELTDRIRVRTR
jgi:sugar fermentation stimulation protein A